VPYLLNIVYLVLLVVASPWLIYAAWKRGKYRQGHAAKFCGCVPRRRGDRRCIWLHAVSVGEVNVLRPLLSELARRRPELECVISTTTATGYALARDRFPNHTVFYFPLDFTWAVRRALDRMRPELLVLVELELWPNLLHAARQRGVRVAVVNARLGERSFRGYRWIGPVARRLLAGIDLVAAQDERIAARFVALGARRRAVDVTGSLKFDGAQTMRANPSTQKLRLLAGFRDSDRIFMAGSTQEPEERLVLECFRQFAAAYPQLRLVIVPRHPERFDAVATLLKSSGLAFQRRTEIEREGRREQARILLVDVVGELWAWWGAAEMAFVGGSFTQRGGQNMIEPAAYGAAVSFGPNTWNFRDIVAALQSADGAVVVRDGAELAGFLRRCLEQPDYAAALGQRARNLVLSQLGATHRTVDRLEQLLAASHRSPAPLRATA
jgi:3-deoxy-D-manno-octulosonic-acid transferase